MCAIKVHNQKSLCLAGGHPSMQAFISYAHDDYEEFERFNACLRPVARALNFEVWADRRLSPGDYWNERIASAIGNSDIHVLLMSIGFFNSDYIYDHELPAIAARCRSGALTTPVLVERCYWSAFVGVLMATPMTERGRLLPVKEWRRIDTGYTTACEQIASAIKDHFKRSPLTPFDWRRP